MSDPFVVAIDGVLGSGKTTVAQRLAPRLGLEYLDTGAMYRSVAVACVWANIALDNHAAVAEIARTSNIEVRSDQQMKQQVRLNGDDVTDLIRTPEIARGASTVATIPAVRSAMVAQQRAWAHRHGGGVLEGRDIATAVFPDAAVKIFLTASVDERTSRRHREQPTRTYEEVRADLEWRDRQDSEREADPLRVAEGARVVDTTGMSLEAVVDVVTNIAKETMPQPMNTDTPSPEQAPTASSIASALVSDPSVPNNERDEKSVLVKHAEELVRPPTRFERALWTFVRTTMVGLCKVFFRLTLEGLEHVPHTGAYLVAATHRSNVDSFVIAGITKRRIRFLGKDSLFKYQFLVPLWHAMGGIKVVRGATDRESMRICMAAMAAGEPLAVYPEGKRKEGLIVEDLFDGPAFMAVKAGVPILPIGIGGSANAMGTGHKFPRPKKIHVVVGPLINNPPAKTSAGRSTVRALTAELQTELQRLFDVAQTRL
jgi:cytidylate kinase